MVNGTTATETCAYTGSTQTFTFPSGISTVTATANGASGGDDGGVHGGLGGAAVATLHADPGTVLTVIVGQAGIPSSRRTFGGGGAGGPATFPGASGGGGSFVETADGTNLLVAGGGGGASSTGCGPGNNADGGAGGGATGRSGSTTCPTGSFNRAGAGGSGAGGKGVGHGTDGAGLICYLCSGGGGGGGGYVGGRGGGASEPFGSGGGGGSGFCPDDVCQSFRSGVHSGNGSVVFTWQTVSSTTTTLTSKPNPSTAGQQVRLTARVSAGSGRVGFTDNGSPMSGCGFLLLAHGEAVCRFTFHVPGAHRITAIYTGDSTHYGSSGSLIQRVRQAATTTTTVQASPAHPVYGDTVSLTATVQPVAPGGGQPGGTVTFRDGDTALGTVDVTKTETGSVATLSTTALAAGDHRISAAYSGGQHFAASTSDPVTVSVAKASTSTTVSADPNPATVGQKVSLTATVSDAGAKALGTVTFTDGTTKLGTARVDPGTARLTTPALAAGEHHITAVYSGDANHTGSTSAPLTVTVNPAAPPTSSTPGTGGPPPSSTPGGPPLASTGANVAMPIGLGLILLLAGTAFVLINRRGGNRQAR